MISLSPDIPTSAREWRNHPEIRRWCRQYTLLSHDEHMRWLDRIAKDPTVKMFGVRDGDAELGVCGLTSIDRQNQSAEFSLYIHPGAQKKGYGGQALRLLLRHGFLDMNLNRIWGESFDENPAKAMFLKLGMKSEGTLRETYFKEGRFINSEIFSILRNDYVGKIYLARDSGISARDLNGHGFTPSTD